MEVWFFQRFISHTPSPQVADLVISAQFKDSEHSERPFDWRKMKTKKSAGFLGKGCFCLNEQVVGYSGNLLLLEHLFP